MGIPGWIATEDAESFFSDVLKIDAFDSLRSSSIIREAEARLTFLSFFDFLSDVRL
jgi:hypothetical protein